MRLARDLGTVAAMGAGLALLRAGAWLVGLGGGVPAGDTRVSPDDGDPPTAPVTVGESAAAMVAAPAPRPPRSPPPEPLEGSLAWQMKRGA
jgi:hypothetical protein